MGNINRATVKATVKKGGGALYLVKVVILFVRVSDHNS